MRVGRPDHNRIQLNWPNCGCNSRFGTALNWGSLSIYPHLFSSFLFSHSYILADTLFSYYTEEQQEKEEEETNLHIFEHPFQRERERDRNLNCSFKTISNSYTFHMIHLPECIRILYTSVFIIENQP